MAAALQEARRLQDHEAEVAGVEAEVWQERQCATQQQQRALRAMHGSRPQRLCPIAATTRETKLRRIWQG
jgi:hypothetical protein